MSSLAYIRQYAMPLALELLPFRRTISGAAERWTRSTAPHHTSADWSGPAMAIAKTTRRTFDRTCAGCGTVSYVEKRDLHNLCRACANLARKTHGLTRRGKVDPLYRVLKSAHARCTYPATADYKHYGARGIKVHQPWVADPSLFVAWAQANGWKPGLELDRIDNDGNYEPGNCRFIPHQPNSQNRRSRRTSIEQVRLIRRLVESGEQIKVAAKTAGVATSTAWSIVHRKSWGNVE